MVPMSEVTNPESFGRVEDDGTVYVRTAEGERFVGQVPDVSPQEAMAFFVRRYESLATEVELLQSRISAGMVSPGEARKLVAATKANVETANAVGDLASLISQLQALEPLIDQQAEDRKAERAAQAEQVKAIKTAMVEEAEKLSVSTQWRFGVNRFRELLEEWKKQPRIDKATDDELWHRFSSARTTFTRRRKADFAEQNARRDQAQRIKEQILEQARPLATSTDWGQTSREFRDLMNQWKAAGATHRAVEDKLWTEFRAIQDQFFNARNAAQNEQDAEFLENLKAKQALLDEAEKNLLPVTDVDQARAGYRKFLEEFNKWGKVPRDSIRSIDNRLSAIDRAIKDAEAAEWKRTDPQARELAEQTVNMFETQIAKLSADVEKAEAAGREKDAKKLRDSIATYQEWLDQARQTLADFTR